MGFFDETLDDLCPSALRIPPLQDPFPFPTITDQRPSPLEPNARTTSNIDREAAKLTGRGKALAEAKPIGESESNELRPIHSTPRKRQKKDDAKPASDFVQLPRPNAKAQDENPRPFLPISVLNALHEPPPSAALFPPITPNASQVERGHKLSDASLSDPLVDEHSSKDRDERSGKDVKGDAECRKRLSLRRRMKWSEEETYNLIKGVDKLGVGKWTKILNHPDFCFSEGRNAIDLKDRFRTVMGNAPVQPEQGVSYQQLLGYAEGLRNAERDRRSQKEEPHQPRRKPKHLWSEEEDESLVKGYQKYGFSWKDIANDPMLALENRTGNQIRDRFRKRFPELYGDAQGPARESQDCLAGAAIVPRPNDKRPGATGKSFGVDSERRNSSNSNEAQNRKMTAPQTKQISSVSAPYDISGLLNSDNGQSRQASFRSDDWGENITLAPLLWEDLCTKPMFELD
ncbi:MAG: hypothetical protein L6R40_001030 [Gallowayella cf. fulva]|nr:MAG: hypothetical protein L6R40_001030 [Xanthomendoza cf. fulva]